MKTLVRILLCLMLLPLYSAAQEWEQIPFKKIREIADRNAQALWGDVYPAEPIPYYGFDDELIAWRFNYSIGKPFPEREVLAETIDTYASQGDKYRQWGQEAFGRILIGARSNMPVLLEYSRCLSAEYALAERLKKLSAEAFGNEEAGSGKIYYLNHFDTWHERFLGDKQMYVCTSPTGGILDKPAFADKKASAEYFCETGNYKHQWDKYLNGYLALAEADKFIPFHECMPYYDWSYGCSPTAAAMLFAWYDYRSLHVSFKYPYFVLSHFQRWDAPEAETDYNVANLQLSLALAMATDTLTGKTQGYMIDNGMRHVANSLIGYDFDIDNRYTFLWTRLKEHIDDGKPLLASIPNHSTTCVGYNSATEMAITHYTHDPPPEMVVYVSRWELDMVTRVSPGGQKGAAIEIISPVGDPRYNRDGNGEVFSEENYAEIKWASDAVAGSWVELLYSTDGGYNFSPIVTETENDGCYDWLIPAGTSSASCRVLANLHTPDMEPYIAGADGSRANFIINNHGAIPTMVSGHIYEAENLTKYFYQEHGQPSWAVIGNHTQEYGSNYQIQLFSNDQFNQAPLLMTMNAAENNFMVMDGNHLPLTTRGLKLVPLGVKAHNSIQYEGGNDNLSLTPGASHNIDWHDNMIFKMYDIHLTPGDYYFKAKRTVGEVDVDIAFFNSNDGSYIKTIHQADYLSDNFGSVEDAFIATITQEDDYGFVMFAKQRGSGTISLMIDDAYIWTGAEDRNWHNPDNWLSGMVPLATSKVAIPPKANQPVISSNHAYCAGMHLLKGANLAVYNYDLQIDGNLLNDGSLYVLNTASRIICTGNVVMARHAYLEISAGAKMRVYGNWTFSEGCNVQPLNGTVEFTGTGNSIIYVKSENAAFRNLRISKTGGAWAAYDNCPGIKPLKIKGQFIIDNGASFIQWAMYNTIFEGPFLPAAGSSFAFTQGAAIFDRTGSGGININSEAGSYFNDVVIDVDDWLGLSSDIEIRGDLSVEGGTLKTNGHDIYLRGDFTQNAGFNHGNAKVVFEGGATQSVNGVNFWRLELNKTGGELRFPANQTNVQQYDWVQGTIRVNGGEVYLWDLTDPGIYGTVIVTSGRLDVRQDPGSFLDLNGNLQISGGEMNLIGGYGDSFWPFSHAASFTMSDGVLDFKTHGLKIHHSATYSLTENITGGTIRIFGDLTIDRTDFNPAGGTILFYGYTEDASLSVATGSNLFNLQVDKISKKKAQLKTLSAFGTLNLNGDFRLTGGRFEAPPKMYIAGLFVNDETPAHFKELSGEVVLDGAINQLFDENETFYKLTINKPGDGAVIVDNGASLTVLSYLLVDRGDFVLEPGASLLLDGTFEANYAGNVDFRGEPGNEVAITSAGKSNYIFKISPGGSIAATHTIFSNMGADGIHLFSGAYVDPARAFTGCTFADGMAGGTLITWNNGADVIVQDAVFPENTTACSYNVRKATNSGQVFFDGAAGPFAGAAFEDDPYSRIDWEYIPPMDLPFVEGWDSASFDYHHWVPEATNWQIAVPLGAPPPGCIFNYTPRLYNYSVPLRSHLIDGTIYKNIYIKFDIGYDNYSTATLEQLKVQLVHKNGDFITLETYNNAGGSFAFTTKFFDVSAFADGEIFFLRFTAFGEDSWNIDRWLIDNIRVYGASPQPGLLKGIVTNLQSGSPVQGAVVTINGTAHTATTDASGYYSILSVPPGIYDVSAGAEGYESASADDVAIVSGESTVQDFAMEPLPPGYCFENLYLFGCASGDGLSFFELRNISNESGCSENGYGDFTALSTPLPRGYAYQVGMLSVFNNQNISLWIDFDDDFAFDETERLLTDFNLASANVLYHTTLVIPADAPLGEHRLRVRTNRGLSAAEPCAAYAFGEAEDYTIEVTDEELSATLYAIVKSAGTYEPLADAIVEIVGTGLISTTGEEGICIIQWIVPDSYTIQITAAGFEPFIVTDYYFYGGEIQTMEVELEAAPVVTHTISIPAGWSGLSSYVFPFDNDIETLFAPLGIDLVLLQNFAGIYWPALNINTLISWEHHSAYTLKVAKDVELAIAGYNETNPVCSLANGWTMLPVICNTNPNTEELFLSELDNLQLVKEIAGTGVYWPAMNINTLPQLQTGKAYLVKTHAACTVTFPENLKHAEASIINTNQAVECTIWDAPVKTSSSHLIVIPEILLASAGVVAGDFLAVFTTEGRCAGMTLVDGSSTVIAFADDPTTSGKEGFVAGEKMIFKWYQPARNQPEEMVLEYDPNFHQGTFDPMGISVVTDVKTSQTFTSSLVASPPVIYPNPASGLFRITVNHFPTDITIFNNLGEKILNKHINENNAELDLSSYPAGMYFVTFGHEGSFCSKRIVVY
ncbi:MAG: carboxypeptidase regulatory-like domain-containing protein [Bacteroidales bacterium]|nr:carboxypeptidase regulatory-like domain-containing protein [Bacteroidales bacterium]